MVFTAFCSFFAGLFSAAIMFDLGEGRDTVIRLGQDVGAHRKKLINLLGQPEESSQVLGG